MTEVPAAAGPGCAAESCVSSLGSTTTGTAGTGGMAADPSLSSACLS